MRTKVQCPNCKGRPEWERSHDPDNRCVIMRCGECGRPMPETLYEHLDALEGKGITTGFTEEEKTANKLVLEAESVFRNMRPVHPDDTCDINDAVGMMRLVLGKRVMRRDLARE